MTKSQEKQNCCFVYPQHHAKGKSAVSVSGRKRDAFMFIAADFRENSRFPLAFAENMSYNIIYVLYPVRAILFGERAAVARLLKAAGYLSFCFWQN